MARNPKSTAQDQQPAPADECQNSEVSQTVSRQTGRQNLGAATNPGTSRDGGPVCFDNRYRRIVFGLAVLYVIWLTYLAWVAYMVMAA